MRRIFFTLVALAFALGCESFGKTECTALVRIAEGLSIQIAYDATSDEEKARMIENYTQIVADLSALGCTFVPPPDAPDAD